MILTHLVANLVNRSALSLGGILLATLIAADSASAQSPQGHIAYLVPAGGQRGETVQVTVGGSDLDEVDGVHLVGAGVTGDVVRVDQGNTATISVTIAAAAECGPRDLRLVSPGGVTNRARFVVGQLPEIVEQEPNSTHAEAQELPVLPVVINGQVSAADKDRFRFSAQAGQTMVCRVEAQSLLPFIADAVPGWFQAVLRLADAEGNHLAHVDDFRFHPDPLLIYEIPQDGDYVLELYDSIYRGREDFVYRLSVGTIPHVTHVYPLGAQRETEARLELFGPNLATHTIALPLTGHSPAGGTVALRRGELISSQLPFAVGEVTESVESEPNDAAPNAHPIQIPTTINGRIQRAGDVDWYEFEPVPGQPLVIDLAARRLDSPLDSVLTVRDSQGRVIQQNDDTEDAATPLVTHHADSHIVHTFVTPGKYSVTVADIQGKGGDEFAYRLHVGSLQPDFQLRVTPDNPRLGQGATCILVVHALRRDGFQGQIDLEIEGLPDGFSASGLVIAENQNEALLTLTAAADAALEVYSPIVLGRANVDGSIRTREAVPAEDVVQAFIYHHLVPTQELLLTVVPPGPFQLIPQTPDGYIQFGGGRTAFLTVQAERQSGIKGPIQLSLHNPPKGLRMQRVAIPAGKNQARCEIKYPNQFPTTVRYNLVVRGSMRIGKQTLTSISPVVLALGPGAKKPRPLDTNSPNPTPPPKAP